MLSQILAQGENPSDQEANDALKTLNEIVDKWNTESLMSFCSKSVTKNIDVSKETWTIGKSNNPLEIADIDVARPVAGIETAYLLDGDVQYKLNIMTENLYRDSSKFDNSISTEMWYNPKYPFAEINLNPAPKPGLVLVLNYSQNLDLFDDLDTIISLPPAYIKALRYNLAAELGFEYNRKDADIAAFAVSTKASIKKLNSSLRSQVLTCDNAILQVGRFNVFTGE